MDAPKTESIAPPPGVIGSLMAGFDTIATHITAILLPVLLDLWLWLGPRLGIKDYYQSLEMQMVREWQRVGVPQAQVQGVIDFYKNTLSDIDGVNLAALLRTFPIGVSSLMSGLRPLSTPLGAPVVHQVGSFLGMLGWMLLLTFVGWLAGYYYFHWVASLVVAESGRTSSQPGGTFLHSLLISLMWAALSLIVGPPLMLLLLLSTASPVLQFAMILLLGFAAMWLIVPLFFSPLGIFVQRQNVVRSILSGMQLARFTLPNSSLFVLTVVLINIGLNFVWSIPPAESWMSLVGILGHAFISTALLAASFIYYRDMSAWLQTMLERIKAGTLTPRA